MTGGNKPRGARRWVWIVVAVALVVIFTLSAQPNSAEFTVAFFGEYNFAARKAAHFIEYAALFFVLYAAGALTFNQRSRRLIACVCLVACVLYAAGDEVHQLFVPGRTASFYDVLLDSAGALTAFVALAAYRFGVASDRR